MADPTTGTVTYIKVNNAVEQGQDLGAFGFLEPGETNAEMVFVWWSVEVGTPATAADWILRNAQIALLRDALVNKLAITVTRDPSTGFVQTLQLGAAP